MPSNAVSIAFKRINLMVTTADRAKRHEGGITGMGYYGMPV